MTKRIIIRNGKKYMVNAPSWDDAPWSDGIGSVDVSFSPTGSINNFLITEDGNTRITEDGVFRVLEN